ncbi:cytochrome c family protein [Novosphingobium sp.]|uniref:c-type cytochrome n=1 Tax=Novosphingobium sp. TaxID=1874826 RepID=UPI00286D9870|nr:cytochrome c family protein [Novosphingobium sp.]
MDDRFNTTAGWVLGAGIIALGLSSISGRYFHADKQHRPEKMGYEIAGVVSSEGGAAKEEPIEARLAAADPAKGEATFAKCKSCHTIDAGGANGIGPNLNGTVGKPVASHPGFAYSDDLKKVGGKWDWTNLDHWLKSPKAMAAGTKMTFAGLSDGAERANVIAYLNTQGSNLPLPAAPKAEAADAGKEGEPAAAASGAPEAAAKK